VSGAYRHQFHAGNFADVFKHALLVQLLLALAAKDKPFCYLETHAGTGCYDLDHAWAQKAREFDHGIGRVWKAVETPAAMKPYLDAVRGANPDGQLRVYPGSPAIARRFLRAGDRMVLAELNKRDCADLEALFAGDRQVQVRCMDGYQALKALLPPKERRGLVLIDSSFDRAGEFAHIVQAFQEATRRFATGVYAIWYPLMEPAAVRGFERDLVATGVRKILQLELAVAPESWTATMRGCGMLIVNPPWRFDEIARLLLAWAAHALAQAKGGGSAVRWLVPE
jgi:23S rRNA (adenine2030-N6)-methyltransferase